MMSALSGPGVSKCVVEMIGRNEEKDKIANTEI